MDTTPLPSPQVQDPSVRSAPRVVVLLLAGLLGLFGPVTAPALGVGLDELGAGQRPAVVRVVHETVRRVRRPSRLRRPRRQARRSWSPAGPAPTLAVRGPVRRRGPPIPA